MNLCSTGFFGYLGIQLECLGGIGFVPKTLFNMGVSFAEFAVVGIVVLALDSEVIMRTWACIMLFVFVIREAIYVYTSVVIHK